MDHIDDVLSSDLLKRYVLGKATAEEKMKVDLLKVEHKAIREELKKLESSKDTPECIIKNISGKEQSDTTSANSRSTNNYKNTSILSSWWKFVAGFILGITGTWLVIDSQLSDQNEALTEVEADMIKLEKDYEELNLQYTFINHAATMPYLLDGKASKKESKVIVYWNDDLQKSQLRVIELPSITKDQTYQLWVDVNGEMLSLGIFDPTTAIVDGIDMNYLANASSLNITVEPKGGSAHPTLTTLTASVSI